MPSDDTHAAPGLLISVGVQRLLADMDFAALTEFSTAEGRRMDLCALGPKGEIWCIEVKSSRADFQADAKWESYLPFCDRLFFAVPDNFPLELLPPEHGLIMADQWGGEIVRIPPEAPVAAARRKAITLRFARLAAGRLFRSPSRSLRPVAG